MSKLTVDQVDQDMTAWFEDLKKNAPPLPTGIPAPVTIQVETTQISKEQADKMFKPEPEKVIVEDSSVNSNDNPDPLFS